MLWHGLLPDFHPQGGSVTMMSGSIAISTTLESGVQDFNPCSFAVLIEEDHFEFRPTYVTTLDFYYKNRWPEGQAPLVLDWAIANESCKDAQRNEAAYACISEHSYCVETSNGPGYFCNCSEGYQGNPYVRGGCQGLRVARSLSPLMH